MFLYITLSQIIMYDDFGDFHDNNFKSHDKRVRLDCIFHLFLVSVIRFWFFNFSFDFLKIYTFLFNFQKFNFIF